MFDKLDAVVARFEQLTEKLADPTLYDRQEEFKKVSSERKNLEDIVVSFKKYKEIKQSIAEAKDMLKNEKDDEMRELAKEDAAEGMKAKAEEFREQGSKLYVDPSAAG